VKRRHVLDPRTDRCRRCGATLFDRRDRAVCAFTFIPRDRDWREADVPRIRRQIARLRRRGLLEDNEAADIVRGNVVGLPGQRERMEVRRMMRRMQEQIERDLFPWPRRQAVARSIRYEDVLAMWRALPPLPKTLSWTYSPPPGVFESDAPRTVEIKAADVARIFGLPIDALIVDDDYRWPYGGTQS